MSTEVAPFDLDKAAAGLDAAAVIRNIIDRIEAADMQVSVGYLAGMPADEAISHELRSLLVDVEMHRGFHSGDPKGYEDGGPFEEFVREPTRDMEESQR